ncbi:MAG: hypothetical protein AABW88_00405 [Nanoarchaeota archaeon]
MKCKTDAVHDFNLNEIKKTLTGEIEYLIYYLRKYKKRSFNPVITGHYLKGEKKENVLTIYHL